VRHSEFNHSKTEPVHLYQIMDPAGKRKASSRIMSRKAIPAERENTEKLRLLASPRRRQMAANAVEAVIRMPSFMPFVLGKRRVSEA